MCLSAQSLTVANGTEDNPYVPFYGYWMDEAQHNQIIYPASMLTNLAGESITGLTFYFESPPAADWMTSTTVKLGITQNSAFSSVTLDATTTTQVYNGSINISGNLLTILFSTPFTYTGGNLLVDLTTQAGTFSDAFFYGITQNGASIYSYSSTMNTLNFLPKTTFLYGNCMAPVSPTISNITTSSATFSWSHGGTESAWEIYIGNGTEDIDTVTTWIQVSDTFYTFQNLTGNTAYTAYVRSICGTDYSFAAISQFRTDCGITPVPYSEGFENIIVGDIPFCWSKLNTLWDYTSSYPMVYQDYYFGSDAHSGTHFLMFEYDNTAVSGIQLAVLPAFAESFNNLQISLYTKRYDYLPSGTFYIGYMTNPAVDSTFVSLFSISASAIGDDNYHKYVVDFSNVPVDPDSTAYIALGYICDNDYGIWFVDDIEVTTIPTCSEPSLLTSSGITAHSATLSWRGGSATEFNVYYKASTDTVYTAELSVTDTFLTISNLLGSSLYNWYVVSVCSGDSTVSDMASFYTNCSAIETLPYFTDFENEMASTLLPYCWTRGTDNSSYPYISTESYQGAQGLYFYSSQPNTVSLPEVNTTAIQLTDARLKFYAKGYSNGVVLQVGVMTNPNLSNSFVQVGPNITLTTSWQQYEVSLANYTGTGAYIALRNTTSSLYVDNVTLEYLPSCNRPEQVLLQSVDSAEASITWTTAAGQSNWEVALTPIGVSPDSVNAASVATNSYSFQNLIPNTTYNVYVRTDCGAEYSAWSNALTFTTLLHAPATVPYSCDFENAAENTAWTILNGSAINAWYIDTASNNTPNGHHGLYISSNNGANNSYNNNSTSNVWAYRDIQFSNANEFTLSFDWNGYGESSFDYLRVFIGNPALVTAGSTTPPAGSTSLGTFNRTSNWVHEEFSLGNEYNNATKRLYFLWHNDGSDGSNPPASVDNITITPVNCARPTGLTVSNVTTTSATITINPASTSDFEWEIQYGTSDTTMITLQTTSLSETLNNLLPATNYTVRTHTICSTTDTSDWSSPITFQTECITITSMPQYWDFESNNIGGTASYPLPVCWDRGTSNSSYPYILSYQAHGGAHSMYFDNNTPNMAVLPVIDTNQVPINSLQVSFYAIGSYLDSYDAKLVVGVVSDAYDNSTFTAVDTIDLTEIYPAHPYVVMFNNYMGNGNRIAFKNYTSSTYAYNGVYLDDVTLEELPSCLPVQNLNVTNYNLTSITLDWTAGDASQGNWNVEYKEVSDTVWTPAPSGSAPYTLTGLTSATAYDIRVQADCGGNDLSPWSYISAHTLLCDTADQCPYTFNLTDGYGDGWNNAWISVIQNGIEVAQIKPTTSFTTTSVTVRLCHNTSTSLVWNEGSFDDECSFTVVDPFGSNLYTCNNAIAGTLHTFNTNCSCPSPSNLTVSNIGLTSATVSWSTSGTGYSWVVEYKPTSSSSWQTMPVTATSYILNGLQAGSAYDVRVKTDCGGGDESNYAETTFVTSLCDIASQCEYTFVLGDDFGDGWNDAYMEVKQNGQVIRTLEALDHDGMGDYTYYDTVRLSLCDNISTSILFYGGEFDDEISLQVFGPDGSLIYSHIDFDGVMPGDVIDTFVTNCGSTPQPGTCVAPTNLTATSMTANSVVLNWTENGTATSWTVIYKEDAAAQSSSATANVHPYTLTGLQPQTTYTVNVVANCADGQSDPSNTVTFTTAPEGIADYELATSLYPNPNNGLFAVVSEQYSVNSVQIYDVYGKLLKTIEVNANSADIDVRELSSGMYFVRIATAKGVVTKSFVKK
jgi:hypothetical protein